MPLLSRIYINIQSYLPEKFGQKKIIGGGIQMFLIICMSFRANVFCTDRLINKSLNSLKVKQKKKRKEQRKKKLCDQAF